MSRLKRLGLPALVLLAGAFLSACAKGSDTPQNVLDPKAPISRQLDDLWNPVFLIAVVIFVIVQGLVLIVVFKFRRRSDDDSPKQVHGSTTLELGWTITPALILLFVGVLTVGNIAKLDAFPKGDNVMRVDVIGHQWWWEFDYAGKGIVTANEMHIPVDEVIDVRITSADVIHSFWPPKLAGKLDAVPNRLNHMQIKTEGVEPGVYWGQCAEYCGLSHANMRLKVVVHTVADYDKWEANQQAAPGSDFADGSAEKNGYELFRTKGCGGCHTVNGYTAGKVGPNLTHFMSREVFAGAIFPNNIEELRAWLRNPPKQKPMMPNNGLGMPNLNLAEQEISDLIAYLQTLK